MTLQKNREGGREKREVGEVTHEREKVEREERAKFTASKRERVVEKRVRDM